MSIYLSFAIATFAVAAGLAAPGIACDQLSAGPSGRVVEVTDGDTIVLHTGLKVRLIGLQAPKLPLGRDNVDGWPLGGEAKSALEKLVLGQEVTLRFAEARYDRHSRALAHVFTTDAEPVWLQQFMLEQGMGRVYSFADNRLCLEPLLKAEAQARAEGLGIWSNPYYKTKAADSPSELSGFEGRYELIEGRVLNADKVSGRIYLNFGRYWKEDFTVVIERNAQKLFADLAMDPLVLDGALVRVRGWVELDDGPRINVTHPEQIEVLAVK